MTQAQSTSPSPTLPTLPVRMLMATSLGLLTLERWAIAGFMFLLTALILLNVVTRYSGMPIYWVDESAVYSVVWLTFIGASAMTRMRLDFAVTLLTERLSEKGATVARAISSASIVAFGLLLGWMCWLWLDPVGFAQAGFDAKVFAGRTFNFIYTERTQTLNWPTWVLYLIMPIFAVSMVIHGLAVLAEDLGLAPRASLPGFASGDAAGIN
jgi:TRAP-type C4-dicarboxylate transport system permease small subunit